MFFVKDQMDHRLTYAHFTMATSMVFQTNVIRMAPSTMIALWIGWNVLLDQTGTYAVVSLKYVWISQSFTTTIHIVTTLTMIHLPSGTNTICSRESVNLIITSTVQKGITIHLLSGMSAQIGVLLCSKVRISLLLDSQAFGLSADPISQEFAKLTII